MKIEISNAEEGRLCIEPLWNSAFRLGFYAGAVWAATQKSEDMVSELASATEEALASMSFFPVRHREDGSHEP